jgi:hypothetical protein
MEFLNKNAPAHAKNHQVLVVTTMWAMEWVSNWKDLDSFFRQLEKSLDEKTLNLAIFKLFQKYAPWFLEHISVNSFPNVYKNLAILYENEQLDKELVELRERGEKWKVIGDFITALEKQKKWI